MAGNLPQSPPLLLVQSSGNIISKAVEKERRSKDKGKHKRYAYLHHESRNGFGHDELDPGRDKRLPHFKERLRRYRFTARSNGIKARAEELYFFKSQREKDHGQNAEYVYPGNKDFFSSFSSSQTKAICLLPFLH
jgi:hypothetical protein